VIALLALALAGTVGPFALFAYGQSKVAPELAGAFLNLEPLVGTAAGAFAFGDPFGPAQLAGAVVILAGIVLSTGEGSRTRTRRAPASAQPAAPVTVEACTDSSRSTWPGRRRPSVAVVAEVAAASRT